MSHRQGSACLDPRKFNMAGNDGAKSFETINVELYDSSCLRRRTTNVNGLQLPSKAEFAVPLDGAVMNEQKQYCPAKRTTLLQKRLAGKNAREKRETFRKENLVLVDLERTDSLRQLVHEELPIFALKTFKEHGEKRYMEFNLSSEASSELRSSDKQGRLSTALAISYANYLYWNKIYEEHRSKDKMTEFEKARQEALEDFLENPLECKGVVYYYQLIDETQPDAAKHQVYIGKSEGELNRRIKEHNTSGNKPLFELSLQDKHLWPSADQHLKDRFKESLEKSKKAAEGSGEGTVPVLDYKPKVAVLVLDFGYTKKFQDKFKGQIGEEDSAESLVRDYVRYFGGKSPIGLNE